MSAPVELQLIEPRGADDLLDQWGHYLGPCRRPFGRQAWALTLDGEPVSVAVSASTVGASAAGLPRRSVVELARLCSDPSHRWASRPMLRLWREVAAQRWPYWPVAAAVAYSADKRHPGDLYRFDGWTRVPTGQPSGGGGSWTKSRAGDAAPASRGRKTLWVWRYATAERAR